MMRTKNKLIKKAHSFVALHAYGLILIGIYHFSQTDEVIRLLLPIVCGVPLLTLNNGIKYFNRPAAFISLFFNVISIGILFWSLTGLKQKEIVLFVLFTFLLLSGLLALISLFILVLEKRRKG